MLAQNNKILGYVKLKSSGNKPLEHVEIWSMQANASYSDAKGYFELEFPRLKPGDVVRNVEVVLQGYTVINEEKLAELVIPNDPYAFQLVIVMANAAEYRKQKARHYRIIEDNVNKNFDACDVNEVSKTTTGGMV